MKSNNTKYDEESANAAVLNLMNDIGTLLIRKDPLLTTIKSPKMLIDGLRQLMDMVEMVNIKYSIVNQIKFLLTNHARKIHHKPKNEEKESKGSKGDTKNPQGLRFDGHMLHTVISGSPGVGKTTVGKILARIWMALGLVNKKRDIKTSEPIILSGLINIDSRERVQELMLQDKKNNQKLEYVHGALTNYYTLTAEMRRLAVKLQKTPKSEEWESFISHMRDLRFGLSNLIRETSTLPSHIPIPLTHNLAFADSIGNKSFMITSDSSVSPNLDAPKVGIRNIGPITTTSDIIDQSLNHSSLHQVLSVVSNKTHKVDEVDNVDSDEEDPTFVVAAREDLIAEYVGQTAPKTKKILESARGGVLFIDEAYSLCNMDGGSKDKYGEECLTTINEFMSLYPDEIIIIFSGYKDKLMGSIFKAQPGLLRRCSNFFEIKDYTHQGLAKIFIKQLNRHEWSLHPDINMEKLLKEHENIIEGGAGFVEKLAFFTKIAYSTSKFDSIVLDPLHTKHDSIITLEMLNQAFVLLRSSSVDNLINTSDRPPLEMYI